jgi:anion-transporting  ArsA/GET3 family ATPase
MVQEERTTGPRTIDLPKGLTSRLDELTRRIEEKEEVPKKGKKDKLFKVPAKLNLNKLKKNYVLLIRLKTNQQVVIDKLPIEDDMIYLKDNDTYHQATTDFVWRYKNFPVMILPEWSLKPIKPEELYNETIQNKDLSIGQRFFIKALESSQIKKKKSMNIWIIVVIIIAIIAGVAILSQVLKKKTG